MPHEILSAIVSRFGRRLRYVQQMRPIEKEKLILRFQKGSNAKFVREFEAADTRSITIGRKPSCDVAYNSETDDLVSCTHPTATTWTCLSIR